MPSYEYKCTGCENISATIQKVDDRDNAPVCEKCGENTERIISKPGLVWAPTSGGYR